MKVSDHDKTADLSGPGIGSYEELAKVLPTDYQPALAPMRRMKALFEAKSYIEDNLCDQLGLQRVQVPLLVEAKSGLNDLLDRDGSRTPVEFRIELAVDFDGNEISIESLGNHGITEAFLLHDVTPMAGEITNRDIDQSIVAPGICKNRFFPEAPLDRIIGM